MLLKMIRSQNTDLGQLRMGVAYGFDMKKPAHAAVAKSLLDRKMAHKTTAAEVEAEAADAAARERASFAETVDGGATAIGDLGRAEKAAAETPAKGKAAAKAAAAPAAPAEG